MHLIAKSNQNTFITKEIMFTAKVYKICIASASGAMKEERIAQDVVARWNCQNGEAKEVIYLQVPQEMAPDVNVFLIDNFVDSSVIDAAIATGVNVAVFFSIYHNPRNTMSSEIEAIEKLRERIQEYCTCIEYKSCSDFEQRLTEYLNSVVAR